MHILDAVDWAVVRKNYNNRIRVHKELVRLHKERSFTAFADVALGITDNDGNYSAAEHGLGPKILALNLNAAQHVFDLASTFIPLADARDVPALIWRAGLKYLQIGVGSEISCMVNPQVCWVANTRTIWTHLVIKHGYDVAKADTELALYRDADVTSEMAYKAWADIHTKLDVALTHVAKLGQTSARKASVKPGDILYLWADAIASHLYGMHHDEQP